MVRAEIASGHPLRARGTVEPILKPSSNDRHRHGAPQLLHASPFTKTTTQPAPPCPARGSDHTATRSANWWNNPGCGRTSSTCAHPYPGVNAGGAAEEGPEG